MIEILILGAAIGLLLLGGWGYTVGRVKESCCAKCRYPVEGLKGETCPECGGALGGRGTLEKRDRRMARPPVPVAIACRTVLVAAAAVVAWVIADDSRPLVVSTAHVRAVSVSRPAWWLHISARGSATGLPGYVSAAPVPRPTATAELLGPRRTVRLWIKDTRGRAVYEMAGTRKRTELNESDTAEWMRGAGVEPTPEEAAAVYIAIRDIARGYGARALYLGPLEVTMDDRHRGTSPRLGVLALVGLPALGLWLLAVRGVRRWGREKNGSGG